MRQTLTKQPKKDEGTHLIGSKFPQQLLLLLPGGCIIDATRKRDNAIAKLGTSPCAPLPSGNRGSKTLESLALFTKLGQDLQKSASNTQRSKNMYMETLALKFLAADALLIARPNSADKQGLEAQELGTLRTVLATQNGRKKRWPGGRLTTTRRQSRRWR